jgi:transcriptional regulator with XRE-family HTH domain
MPAKRPVGSGMYRAFGRRISRARREHNLKAEELGQRVGVTRNTVYSWEAGNTHPHGSRLHILAEELKLDVNELEDLISKASRDRTVPQPVSTPTATQAGSNQVFLEIGGLRLEVRQTLPIYVRMSIGPIESLEVTQEPR